MTMEMEAAAAPEPDGSIERHVLTRGDIIRAIENHHPVGGPDESTEVTLALTELSAALAEIKRALPDYRHKTGGILLRSLTLLDDTGPATTPRRIEAPLSIRFLDCVFEKVRADEPIRLSDLSVNALIFERCRFHGPLWIDNTIVLENLEIVDPEFTDWFQVQRTRVQGDIRLLWGTLPRASDDPRRRPLSIGLLDCRTGGVVWISNAPPRTSATLRHVGIGDEFGIQGSLLQDLRIADCRFDDDVKIADTEVADVLRVASSTIRGDFTWTRQGRAADRNRPPDPWADDLGDRRSMVVDRLEFDEVEVGGSLSLEDLRVRNEASGNTGSAIRVGLVIDRCNFAGNADLSAVEISDGLAITDSRFGGVVRMRRTRFGVPTMESASDDGTASSGATSRAAIGCIEIRNTEVAKGIEFAHGVATFDRGHPSEYYGGALFVDSKFGKLVFNEATFSPLTAPGNLLFEPDLFQVTRCRVGGSLTFTSEAKFFVDAHFHSVTVDGAVEFKGGNVPALVWKDSRIDGAFAFIAGSAKTIELDGTRCDELRLFSRDDVAERIALVRNFDKPVVAQSIDKLVLVDTHAGRLSGDLSKWIADPHGEHRRHGSSDGSGTTHSGIGCFEMSGFTFDRIDKEAYDSLVSKAGRGGQAWLEAAKETTAGTEPASRTVGRPFDALPWTHLADVLRRMGDPAHADDLSIGARRRQRTNANPFEWVFDWILDVTGEYGYKPLRTLGICALFIALAYSGSLRAGLGDEIVVRDARGKIVDGCTTPVVVTRRVPGDFELASGDDKKAGAETSFKATAYPSFVPLLYHLDTFFPLLDLDMHSSWIANTGVYWDPGSRTYLVPARLFPKACIGGASPTPERRVEATLFDGSSAHVKWYGETDFLVPAGSSPIGYSFFLAFTGERLIGGILTALLIVGLTGFLRRSAD